MGPSDCFTHGLLYWIVGTGYRQVILQVMYLGRALRTKETLSDFRECRVGYSISMSILRINE